MEKINIDMYIRTKDGIIDKILKLNKSYVKGVSQKDELYAYDIDNIVKASHNIIDLIEVGDYVNGNLVSFVGADSIEVFWYKDEKQWLDKEDIKSIVTKEQFEQMAYKVGD